MARSDTRRCTVVPHRIYRLAIVPERAPDVKRVVDFDGRHTLGDVHDAIQTHFGLDDDHLYAFYMSGVYWDDSTEYLDARAGRRGSDRHAHNARLFRLGLKQGTRFAYVFDFGDEQRHSLEVVSVTEVPAPLAMPQLVEAIGDPPEQYDADSAWDDEYDEDDEPVQPQAGDTEHEPFAELGPLRLPAITLCQVIEELEEQMFDGAAPHEQRQPLLRGCSAALELARLLEGDRDRLQRASDVLVFDLLESAIDLSMSLAHAELVDEASELALAWKDFAPEIFLADRALILAKAGRADEARLQVTQNLDTLGADPWVRMKAGDVHAALGESTQAETFYRELMSSTDNDVRTAAIERLVQLLHEQGRSNEARALGALLPRDLYESASVTEQTNASSPADVSAVKVGRNDPCPCGSGQKYKKCCAKRQRT